MPLADVTIRRSGTLAERVTIQREQFPLKSEDPRMKNELGASLLSHAAGFRRLKKEMMTA
jgi:hypothetical protein